MSEQQVTTIEVRDGIVLVQVEHSRMDEELTRIMQADVLAAAERARHLPVALDMSQVEFFPSMSLGAVVTLLKKLRAEGQKFVLVGLQPPVREALAITRLDKLFEIYDSHADALACLRRRSHAADE